MTVKHIAILLAAISIYNTLHIVNNKSNNWNIQTVFT